MKQIEKLYDLYSKDVYRFIYSLSFDEEVAKRYYANNIFGVYKEYKKL